ncbi:hypothetical protein CMESO_301 (nucleomorph) [Chroomonas mesostigmatica CCMP1168]|uniref:YdbS-like PH domain-containing protein n=1 Tax=Chroomonas mesostigmatica CCMP1168 TaxID=1195612 RepID=J7G5X5_9CRYP|nr:hypothetical protein CMESO_301 [Chroomonas mesostigmatica CCMP1168]|mmetsp:Transcript_59577/g.146337  ORF Transcript_59577/g.146337 Transcript_59577/m.146337 type:complete len:178 (+) Transcript_59577:2950-3483(+)
MLIINKMMFFFSPIIRVNQKKNEYFYKLINYSDNKKKFCVQMGYKNSEQEEKKKLESEKIFFQGPPSISELLIPTISILTVIGIIPFIATLSRQFWVRYTITNRRISVDSGFQGKNRVEIVYRDIKKVSHLTRLGGLTADVVIILKDNARLELRSLPNWKENKEFIQANSSNKSEEK